MKNNKDKFEQDLTTLLSRLTAHLDNDLESKLNKLKDELFRLHEENVVKINHSVMELVCAKYLILKGYEVQVEHQLNEILTCDLYAVKGFGNFIIEIETGFIPPEHAMDPLTYTYARLASKIIRYSSYAGKFALGIPPHYMLPLPRALALPPRKRTPKDIKHIKKLCDLYYQNPAVTANEILNARIHEIDIIDVDRLKIQAMDPDAYMKRALHKGVIFTLKDETVIDKLKTPEQERDDEKIDYYTK